MLKTTRKVEPRLIPYYQLLYWLIALMLVSSNVKASDTLLLLSSDSPAYQTVATSIISQGPTIPIDTSYPDNLTDNAATHLATYSLLIAVGTKATEFAMQFAAQDSVILSTFIPSQGFHKLSEEYATALKERGISTTAIYLDQPLERQLKLATQIKPDLKRLGFTLGPDSQYLLPQLESAATNLNLSLNYQTLTLESNPIQSIQPVMEDSDLFLVIPDQSTLNRTTAKWLLYMSLRNQVPLLAFSQNYVKAGAVAACITTPEEIGRYTAEQLHIIIQGTLPLPSHSPYFTIITNPRIARKLGLKIKTADELQQTIVESEAQ